jgi:cell division protein FtsL
VRAETVDNVVLSKSIDNSGVVREVDPRTSRDLAAMLLLTVILVGGLVLYAWPHFQMRQTAIATEQMQAERERLIEENRKLRLEKASLEDLARVAIIAERHLGLEKPDARRVVVVETSDALPDQTQLASSGPVAAGGRE